MIQCSRILTAGTTVRTSSGSLDVSESFQQKRHCPLKRCPAAAGGGRHGSGSGGWQHTPSSMSHASPGTDLVSARETALWRQRVRNERIAARDKVCAPMAYRPCLPAPPAAPPARPGCRRRSPPRRPPSSETGRCRDSCPAAPPPHRSPPTPLAHRGVPAPSLRWRRWPRCPPSRRPVRRGPWTRAPPARRRGRWGRRRWPRRTSTPSGCGGGSSGSSWCGYPRGRAGITPLHSCSIPSCSNTCCSPSFRPAPLSCCSPILPSLLSLPPVLIRSLLDGPRAVRPSHRRALLLAERGGGHGEPAAAEHSGDHIRSTSAHT